MNFKRLEVVGFKSFADKTVIEFDGGITGISIIISKLTKIPLSMLIIILNIPFIYIGYKNIGKGFLIRTIYSIGK